MLATLPDRRARRPCTNGPEIRSFCDPQKVSTHGRSSAPSRLWPLCGAARTMVTALSHVKRGSRRGPDQFLQNACLAAHLADLRRPFYGGTQSSNPSPSGGQSVANLAFAGASLDDRRVTADGPPVHHVPDYHVDESGGLAISM
jgi:hypothetical protein